MDTVDLEQDIPDDLMSGDLRNWTEYPNAKANEMAPIKAKRTVTTH